MYRVERLNFNQRIEDFRSIQSLSGCLVVCSLSNAITSYLHMFDFTMDTTFGEALRPDTNSDKEKLVLVYVKFDKHYVVLDYNNLYKYLCGTTEDTDMNLSSLKLMDANEFIAICQHIESIKKKNLK